jgi:YjbR
VTADDFRELALSLEGATEKSHMGHPDFRANGRIFSTLGPGEKWGMVKLTPGEQKELMRLHPKAFSPASGAWGRQGCTTVHLEAADKRTVRGAVLLAWQHVIDQPAPRPRSPKRRA